MFDSYVQVSFYHPLGLFITILHCLHTLTNIINYIITRNNNYLGHIITIFDAKSCSARACFINARINCVHRIKLNEHFNKMIAYELKLCFNCNEQIIFIYLYTTIFFFILILSVFRIFWFKSIIN